MRIVYICETTEPVLLAARKWIEHGLGVGVHAEPQLHRGR